MFWCQFEEEGQGFWLIYNTVSKYVCYHDNQMRGNSLDGPHILNLNINSSRTVLFWCKLKV